MTRLVTSLFLVTLLFTPAASSLAQEQNHQHMPVAFRTWPNETISIETFWGFQIALGKGAADVPGIDQPDLTLGAAGLAISTSVPTDSPAVKWDKEKGVGSVTLGADEGLELVLDRAPNTSHASLYQPEDHHASSGNAVRVWSNPIGVTLIQADGVNVVYGLPGFLKLAAEEILEADGVNGSVDVVAVVVRAGANVTPAEIAEIAQAFNASYVSLVNGGVDMELPTRQAIGNTTALIAGAQTGHGGPVLLQHADEPWQKPDAMAELLKNLEASARQWAPVYEKLSVNQMNHRPSNGTHTPRWNIEHLAGRQVFFFTYLFNAFDSSFPNLRIDPAQMPDDYKARHPDWDGAEEARRIYRSCAFLNRFAYVYGDRDLNQRPPSGAGVTFRGIALQITGHYPEHTGHVLKKMELADWPAE